MKKRILALLLAVVMVCGLLPVGAVAADEPNYELKTLTFEGSYWDALIDDPQYGGSLLYGSGMGFDSAAAAYKWTDSGNTELSSTLSEGYGSWCYWNGGHAVSHYVSGAAATYGGYENQLTVYKQGVSGLATTGGGHDGSDNFAVHYGYTDNSGFAMLTEDTLPSISFSDGVARVIDSMWVNNTCYAVGCYLEGNGLTPKISDGDWVKIVATGYNGTTKGKTAEIFLCNGPQNIVTDWTKWDLSGLGAVTKVTFNLTGSSDNGYGFSQPAYFAYDDVAVRVPKPPVSVTVSAPNAASAKLFAESDTDMATNLLSGTGAYTALVAAGSYRLCLYDGSSACLGSILLPVSADNASFTVYAVSVTCENEGWVCGTDYSVTAQARSGGAAATVTRTVTLGDSGSTFPCLEGDNVTATIVPSGSGKSAGYASAAATNSNNPSVVTGAGFAALSGKCEPATSLTVTYPYADTNGDGANDFVLEVGTMSNYYVYSYASPLSVSSPSASTVTATFMAAKNTAYFYKVSNPLNGDAVSYGNYVTTAKTDGATAVEVTAAQMYIGDGTPSADTVIRDYSNNEYDSGDLYLASNAPEFHSKTGAQGVIRLSSGGSCTLYPYRNWLIIENTGNAQVIEPDFHVQVINVEGSPITVTENTANDAKKHSYEITANSAGTAVLLVTYDAVTADQAMGSKGKFFSAIRPENTGVLVVTVDGTDDVAANMLSPTEAVNTAMDESGTAATGNSARVAGANFDAELDRLYFYTDDGASYRFTPEAGTTVTMAKGVQSGTVSFSAEGVSQEGDTVTLSGIPEGKTIVKLVNGEKTSYQVLRATRTNVTVKDAAGNVYYDSAAGTRDESMKFVPGDKVTLTYSKLEHPAQKLSGIYNMNCTVVPYGEGIAVEKGSGFGVYIFNNTPSNWTTAATIPADVEGGSYALTALIRQTGFGSYYGDHRFVAYESGKTANFVAVQQNAWFGGLPAIELPLVTETMELTVCAVDEQDAPIADAGIEITDSNGAVLTPVEGKYAVYPGKTYSYSATAAGRVRVFGSFTPALNESTRKIVIPLPAGGAWGGTTSEPQKDDNDIYQIGTGAELAWLAAKVNDGTAASASAKLTADIDLSNLDWTPIGSSSKNYTGTFDGDGHIISGLYINAASDNQGLFGYVNGATVKNLGVTGNVKSTKNSVAGIVGYAKGSFVIENCFNAADVTGKQGVGGILGASINTGTLKNCFNRGSIAATSKYGGGISGCGATTAMCPAATNCYNIGKVNCAANGGAINPGAATKATNSYYLDGCYLTGTSAKAGAPVSAAELKDLAPTLGEAYAADRWGMNGGYPILKWQDHEHEFSAWTEKDGTYTRSCVCAVCGKTFTEESVSASVSYTAQYQGEFLFAPQSGVSVDSTLAERYGFADSVEPTENVSVLDVLVAAHELKYGSSFTKENAAEYLAIGQYGSPDKQFGVASATAYGGFFYNRAMANDGTKYDNNYNGTTVTTQAVTAGDLVEFFFYEDEFWGDTYNWFVGSGGYARSFSVTAGQGLELTLKGFGAMSASCFKDSAEMIASANAAAISDAQIYTVDLTTGEKTALSGAVTDENGKVTLTFANAGTYTIAAYGTADCAAKQLLSLTTVSVSKASAPPSGDTPTAEKITVTFRLIGAEKAAQDVDLSADDYLPKYVTWLPTGSYRLDKNATVYDLFTEALDRAGLTYVGAENNYVSTIYAPKSAGGYALSEFTNGNFSGWMYTVNGSHPDVGLKAKRLSNGDAVVWHYVNDYRYEVADWMEGSVGTSAQQNLWLKAADTVPKTPTADTGSNTGTGSGGNTAGKTADADTAETTPDESQKVSAENGEAKAEISAQQISDAVAAAVKDGADAIVIAPAVEGDAGRIEVSLPADAIQDIVTDTDIALTVQTDVGSLNIPNDTLAEIVAAAGDADISVTVEAADVADVRAGLPEGVKTENAVAVRFTITAGEETVSSFGGKALEVSFPVDTGVYETGRSYVVYVVSDDGSVSKTTASVQNGIAVVTMTHFSTVILTDEEALPFTDIDGHWGYDAIRYACHNGLMVGVGGGRFDPDGTLNRAMLVTILYRLEGSPAVTAENPFDDVKEGKWYTDAVIWAAENGLVNGCGNGKFAPEDAITREQMAKILFAHAKLRGFDVTKENDLAAYADADKISAWATEAMRWANAEGLITGRTAETLVPRGNATRAEAATILMRYLENAEKK